MHLKKKRRGKVTRRVLFLHDNAPAQRVLATQKKLDYLRFQSLDRPPYFTDLTPVGLVAVPWTEKQFEGGHFSCDAEVIAAAETWWDGQHSEFFF